MKLPQAFPLRPCTASWVVLLGLTTITFELGSGAPGQTLMAAVLALTLVKGQLVVSYFMGLRRVRPLWRLVMAAYLATVGGIIALAYLTA
ncbi:MAG TPA: cytochrome C oxidase subunit IV family protein [Sulfuriferula sp.]|nr:cytochrome C oxidase subunit IV family protein [Sulfuriferula sp.]